MILQVLKVVILYTRVLQQGVSEKKEPSESSKIFLLSHDMQIGYIHEIIHYLFDTLVYMADLKIHHVVRAKSTRLFNLKNYETDFVKTFHAKKHLETVHSHKMNISRMIK